MIFLRNVSLTLDLGCYKREKDVSYVLDKVVAKQDNRPETFYFGQMEQDVDACEAACKDEPDCVAYTLYQVCVLYYIVFPYLVSTHDFP